MKQSPENEDANFPKVNKWWNINALLSHPEAKKLKHSRRHSEKLKTNKNFWLLYNWITLSTLILHQNDFLRIIKYTNKKNKLFDERRKGYITINFLIKMLMLR